MLTTGATQDSVLIEQVVYLASKARAATGQDPIFDIPKGTSSASHCPVARALNLNCSVSSGAIRFTNAEHAELVAQALNLTVTGSREVSLPSQHPIAKFVRRFDAGYSSREMRRLRRGAAR